MSNMLITEETKAHAQEVYDFLTFNPHLHDQMNWFDSEYPRSEAVVSEDKNVCNTTMCVAGASGFIRKGISGLREFEDDEDMAVQEAGVALGMRDNMGDLFYCFNETRALEMLSALANGDEDKFQAISDLYEKEDQEALREAAQE